MVTKRSRSSTAFCALGERCVTSMALLALTSCSAPTPLHFVDGGVPQPDGGFLPDSGVAQSDAGGDLDAGVDLDAGTDDAGIQDEADAGHGGVVFTPTDAGPGEEPCVLERRVFSWTCEGDEDYCASGDDPAAPMPEIDLVASWSHLEGEDVVIYLRTRALLFGHERTELDLCPNWVFDVPASSSIQSQPLISCPGGVIGFGSTPPYYYPLSRNAGTSPEWLTFDICRVEVGLDAPLIRYRIPIQGNGEVYTYQARGGRRVTEAEGWQMNFLSDGPPEGHVTGGGGVPDDVDLIQFVSVCDATCSDLLGVSE